MSPEKRKGPIATMPATKFLDPDTIRATSDRFSYFDASCFSSELPSHPPLLFGPDAMVDTMAQYRQLTHEENVAHGEHVVAIRSDVAAYARRVKKIDLSALATGSQPLDRNLKLLFTELHTTATKLALGNYGLIPFTLFKFFHSSQIALSAQDREDFAQVGWDGLFSASKRFDPWHRRHRSKNPAGAVHLSTYAVHYIWGRMRRFYPELSLIRVNTNEWRNYVWYRKVMSTLADEGREITDENIALYMDTARKNHRFPTDADVEKHRQGTIFDQHRAGITRGIMRRLQRIENALHPIPLVNDRSFNLRDPRTGLLESITFEDGELVDGALTEPPPDELVDQHKLNTDLHQALQVLPDRHRDVLELRYGLRDSVDHTLDEIGELIHVTRERVRQIESAALSKLRHPRIRRVLRDYLLW